MTKRSPVSREGCILQWTAQGLTGLSSGPDGTAEGGSVDTPKETGVTVLLGRADYLLKVMEIPAVAPEQVRSVLTLEIEAMLPADFGPFELAFTKLPCPKPAYQRYEVYVSAAATLQQVLERLNGLAMDVQAVAPSAVAWRQLMQQHPECGVLIARLDEQTLEFGALSDDGSLSIRSLTVDPYTSRQGLVIAQALQPLAQSARAQGSRTVVGDLAGVPHLGESFEVKPLLPASGADRPPLTAALASALADGGEHTWSLLPAELVTRRSWRRLMRRTVLVCGTILLAIALLAAAIEVAACRVRWANQDLEARISGIRAEGDSIGRAIEQLSAVQSARQTQNSLGRVLDGLLDATPPNVTYSQIDLRNARELTLRGSAQTLSAAFVLPEALEKQPIFKQVLLRDAGQSKASGGGTTAEFDLQCILAPRAKR